MNDIMKKLFLVGVFALALVLHLYLVPVTIMFVWDNLVVVNTPDTAHMTYVVALGFEVLIGMVFKYQFYNLKINLD